MCDMPADAEPGYGNSPQRLGRDEINSLVRRLYDQQMERAARREEERRLELSRLRGPMRRIKKGEEENLVHRIYDEQLQRFRLSRDERERQLYEETHRNDKKMSEAEIQEQIDRIYFQGVARKKKCHEELRKRYLPELPPKKIDKAKLMESVQRLYHIDYAKKDEELFKKHVYPYDPPQRKILPADLEAMANRLSTRGGG